MEIGPALEHKLLLSHAAGAFAFNGQSALAPKPVCWVGRGFVVRSRVVGGEGLDIRNHVFCVQFVTCKLTYLARWSPCGALPQSLDRRIVRSYAFRSIDAQCIEFSWFRVLEDIDLVGAIIDRVAAPE